MANISGTGTVWNLPNYIGQLYTSTPAETPFLNLIANKAVKTDNFQFPTGAEYSISGASQPEITEKKNLRRRGKRSITRNANYNTIKPDRIIPQWTAEIAERSRIGDWEGDTVYGGVGKGLLVSLVDRKSRFLRIGLLKKREATETRMVMVTLLSGLPVKSISLDNGSEFSDFRQLENNLKAEVYFAEPHKPRQRGPNENTNDIIRFFFKKGFYFRTVTDYDIQIIENLINNSPRKCLGWRTPREVLLGSLSVFSTPHPPIVLARYTPLPSRGRLYRKSSLIILCSRGRLKHAFWQAELFLNTLTPWGASSETSRRRVSAKRPLPRRLSLSLPLLQNSTAQVPRQSR